MTMHAIIQLTTILLVSITTTMCSTTKESPKNGKKEAMTQQDLNTYATAYVASGCFWCVEAIYESVEGVVEAVSGYAGGETKNPTYRAVGSGQTGHTETVALYYDTTKVNFETLIKVYYGSQDPTTIGQKPDFGSQYRSVIFYQSPQEKEIAERWKNKVAEEIQKEVVTEILPFEKFYVAEAYHQDFEKRNPNQSYVQAVSIPRLKRFQAKFPELLKTDAVKQ